MPDNNNPESNIEAGVSRYLESLEAPQTTDPFRMAGYQAKHISNRFPSADDRTQSELFSYVLGGENSPLSSLKSPNMAGRFLSGLDSQNELKKNKERTNPAVSSHIANIMRFKEPGNDLQQQEMTTIDKNNYNSKSTLFTNEVADAVIQTRLYDSPLQNQNNAVGFLSRPGVGFYGDLITNNLKDREYSLIATYFQLQNTDVVGDLFRGKANFRIGVQALNTQTVNPALERSQQDLTNKELRATENVRRNILAGNELTLQIAESWKGKNPSSDTQKSVIGINYEGTFHPKTGAVVMKDSADSSREVVRMAYIGSQNITPATSGNNTMESILVLDAQRGNPVERRAAEEVKVYTESLLALADRNRDAANKTKLLTNKELGSKSILREMKSRGIDKPSFLRVNEEIGDTYTKALRAAAQQRGPKKDTVIISTSNLTNLKGEYGTLRSSLITLARQKRLVLILDKKEFAEGVENTKGYYDPELIKVLADEGSIRLSTFGKHHDKSLSIVSADNELQFFTTGSGNLTKAGLGAAGKNVEVNVAFGIGPYGKTRDINEQQDIKSYLNDVLYKPSSRVGMPSEMSMHYATLSGGASLGKQYYSRGYSSDRPSALPGLEIQRVETITKLKEAINLHSKTGVQNALNKSKYSVEAKFRYAPELRQKYGTEGLSAIAPIGLTVQITSADGLHRTSVDLGVSEEGNVILSDQKKVINGSMFVNKSDDDFTLFETASELETGLGISKKMLAAGEATKLNAIETTLGLIDTIQTSFAYESEFGLITDSFSSGLGVSRDSMSQGLKQLMIQGFSELFPDRYDSGTNLLTIITDLTRQDKQLAFSAIEQTVAKLAVTQAIPMSSPLDIQKRYDRLEGFKQDLFAVIEAQSTRPGEFDLYDALDASVTNLLEDIGADKSNVFGDIKKALLFSDDVTRNLYRNAARLQSSRIVSQVTEGFLGLYQETYSQYQGAGRTLIFGRTGGAGSEPNSEFERILRGGILNPITVGHHTKVGEAGELYRSLASTSYGQPLQVPRLGNIFGESQVNSALNTQAAAAQDMVMLLESTPGLMRITQEGLKDELKVLLKESGSELELDESAEGLLTELFGKFSSLIYTPFEKAEQLTQRLKNTVGFRPILDINEDMVASMLDFLHIDRESDTWGYYGIDPLTSTKDLSAFSDDPIPGRDSMLAGKLRSSLPIAQMRELKALIDAGYIPNDRASIEAYLRSAAVKQGNVKKGFIGPAKLKRVAINAGVSTFGDFNYLNPGYRYIDESGKMRSLQQGKTHPVQINFDMTNEIDGPSTAYKIGELFKGEVLIFTQQYTDRDGVVRAPGMYTQNEKGELIQVGEYTTGKVISLIGITKTVDTPLGRTKERITIKDPGYGRREEGAITRLYNAQLIEDRAGRARLQMDSIIVYRPGDNSRWLGGGTAKGPVEYREAELFNVIDENLQARKASREGVGQVGDSYNYYMPQSVQADKLYGLTSFNTFKGVNYETGLALLAESDTFIKLKQADGLKVAQALSLLFLKDSEVRKGLQQSLRDSGNYAMAMAIEQSKNKDLSGSKDLALSAAGLLGLGGEDAISGLDLSKVKDEVIKVLKGEDPTQLAARASNLFDLTRQGDNALIDDSGQLIALSEQTGINRGAGILAHLMQLSSSMFDPGARNLRQGSNIAGLYDVGLDRTDLYFQKNNLTSVKGFSSQQYREYVDSTLVTMGFDLKKDGSLTEKEWEVYMTQIMSSAQSILRQSFVIETLMDITTSQSAVTSGMHDTVKSEFQFYMGLRGTTLDAFRSTTGRASKELHSLQDAYMAVSAAISGNVFSLTTKKTPRMKIALVSDSPLNRGFLSAGTLDLRVAALLNTVSARNIQIGNNVSAETRSAFEVAIQKLARAEQERDAFLNNQSDVKTAAKQQYDKYVNEARAALDVLKEIRNKEAEIGPGLDSLGDNYLSGLQEIETVLAKFEKQGIELDQQVAIDRMKQEVGQTMQIMLPQIATVLKGDSHVVQVVDPTQAAPTVGILLGSDFTSRIGLNFGDYQSDILNEQLELIHALYEAKEVTQKIIDHKGPDPLILSDEEIERYRALQAAIVQSGNTLQSIPSTDIARQFAGDHEPYKGAVGVPTNSFLLNPDEILMGRRYLRLAGSEDDMTAQRPAVDSLISVLTAKAASKDAKISGKAVNNLTKVVLAHTVAKDRAHINSINYALPMGGQDGTAIRTKFIEAIAIAKYLNEMERTGKVLDKQDLRTAARDAVKKVLASGEDLSGPLTSTEKMTYLKAQVYQDILDLGGEYDSRAIIMAEILRDRYEITGKTEWTKEKVITAEVKNTPQYTIQRLAALSAGFMLGRTGAPAASGAIDVDSPDGGVNSFTPLHLLAYKQRYIAMNEQEKQREIEEGGLRSAVGYFMLDQGRSETAMVVPSISRLISGLGDYDGDSYRLMMNRLDVHTQKAAKLHASFYKADRARREYDRQLKMTEWLKTVETQVITTKTEVLPKFSELDLEKDKLFYKKVNETKNITTTSSEVLGSLRLQLLKVVGTPSDPEGPTMPYLEDAVNAVGYSEAVPDFFLIADLKQTMDEGDISAEVDSLLTNQKIINYIKDDDNKERVNTLLKKAGISRSMEQTQKIIDNIKDPQAGNNNIFLSKSGVVYFEDEVRKGGFEWDDDSFFGLQDSYDPSKPIEKGHILAHSGFKVEALEAKSNFGKKVIVNKILNTASKLMGVSFTKEVMKRVAPMGYDAKNPTDAQVEAIYAVVIQGFQEKATDEKRMELADELATSLIKMGVNVPMPGMEDLYDYSYSLHMDKQEKLKVYRKEIYQINEERLFLAARRQERINEIKQARSLSYIARKATAILENVTMPDDRFTQLTAMAEDMRVKELSDLAKEQRSVSAEMEGSSRYAYISGQEHLEVLKASDEKIKWNDLNGITANLPEGFASGLDLESANVSDIAKFFDVHDLTQLSYEEVTQRQKLATTLLKDLISKKPEQYSTMDNLQHLVYKSSIDLTGEMARRINQDYDVEQVAKEIGMAHRSAEDMLNAKRLIMEDTDRLFEEDEVSLEEYIQAMTSHAALTNKLEGANTTGIRNFLRAYSNMPEIVTEDFGPSMPAASTGELLAYLNQKYDTGGLEIDSNVTEEYRNNLLLMGALAENEEFQRLIKQDFGSAIDINDRGLIERYAQFLLDPSTQVMASGEINDMLNLRPGSVSQGINTAELLDHMNLDKDTLQDRLVDVLGMLQGIASKSSDPVKRFKQLAQEALAQTVSATQAMSTVQKKVVGRMGNALLNPLETEGTLRAIGEGGTSLIGTAYNTLIPLLDSLMIEQPFMYDLDESSDLVQAVSTLDMGLAMDLGLVASPIDISDGKATKKRMRDRFAGRVSLLENFQQIVRDALKAKEGGGLVDLLHDGRYGAERLSILDILSNDYEGMTPEAADKERKRALTSLLFSQMGPQIGADSFLTRSELPTEISGFGALMMLSDYTSIADPGEILSTFFGESSDYKLDDAYTQWVQQGLESERYEKHAVQEELDRMTGTNIEELKSRPGLQKAFIEETIVDLMQRTRASFTASDEKYQERMFKRFQGLWDIDVTAMFSKGGIWIDKAQEVVRQRHLLEEVKQVYDTFDDMSAEEQKAFKAQLANEWTLLDLKERDKKLGVLDVSTVQFLKRSAQSVRQVESTRLDDQGLSPENMLLSGNSLVYNQLIAALRRGRIKDKNIALEASQFKLHVFAQILQKSEGVSLMYLSREQREAYRYLKRGPKPSEATTLTPNDFVAPTSDENVALNATTSVTAVYDSLMDFDSQNAAMVPEHLQTAAREVAMMGMLVGMVESSPELSRVSGSLLKFMATKFEKDETTGVIKVSEAPEAPNAFSGLELLARQAAGLSTMEQLTQQLKIAEDDPNQQSVVQYLQFELEQAGLATEGGGINVDHLADLPDSALDVLDIQQAEEVLAEKARQTQESLKVETRDMIDLHRKRAMRGAVWGEAIGILASPILFAIAGSDEVEVDESVAMVGVDVLQGIAELSGRKGTATSQYLAARGKPVESQVFRKMRIKSAIEAEGLVTGTLKGVQQELLFTGISMAAETAVDQMMNRALRADPSSSGVAKSLAVEVLSTIMAQGIARGMTNIKYNKRQRASTTMVAKAITAMQNQVEDTWRQLEEAYLAAQNQNVDVVDTAANESISWESSGYESDFTIDIDTGLVVLDNDGNGITTEFETNEAYEFAMSVAQVSDSQMQSAVS